MSKRQGIPRFRQPILTPRFELQPIGRWMAIRLQHTYLRDAEIRSLLTMGHKPPGWLKLLRGTRRANGKTRFYHAIVDRSTGATIGYHAVFVTAWKTATFLVIVGDKAWWGKGVVPEIRKALIIALVRHGGMAQISSRVQSHNYSSMLNYAKLGFEKTGMLHMSGYDEVRGKPADYLVFSLRGQKMLDAVEKWEAEGALVSE